MLRTQHPTVTVQLKKKKRINMLLMVEQSLVKHSQIMNNQK